MKKSIQAQELITGIVKVMDACHTMPEGAAKHPSVDVETEEVSFQMAREATRECTCGSREHWANCSAQSQYCG